MTPTQRRVIEEVARGYRYAEVAQRLGIAQQTVKNHVHTVRQLYGAQTNAGLFAALGWLTVPAYEFTYYDQTVTEVG